MNALRKFIDKFTSIILPEKAPGYVVWAVRGLCYCLLLGLLTIYLEAFGLFTFWHRLPSPDQDQAKVVDLRVEEHLGTNASTVAVIETEDGVAYIFRPSLYMHESKPWDKQQNKNNLYFWILDFQCTEESSYTDYFWVYTPPGPVVSRVNCLLLDVDVTITYRFVLLKSGEVWIWHQEDSFDGIPWPILYSIFIIIALPIVTPLFAAFIFLVGQALTLLYSLPEPEKESP